ncbi:MAG: tyrosine-type recombinase/integrase [Bacteroidia bacterium]
MTETVKQAPSNNMHWLALQAYVELLRLRNYSLHTIENYHSWFLFFLNYFPKHKPSAISKNEILDFMVSFRNSNRWSATSQNQLINAIKFFYEQLLNRPKAVYDLPRAKKETKLPTVFAEEEIKAMITAAGNIKHRVIICLAYSAGFRISEIINLKIGDIDSQRMVITIRQSKGRKDRQVMLSPVLLEMLREYYKIYKPAFWLFEGWKGMQYTTRSIGLMLQRIKAKAGVTKKGSIHAVRHSFATHLLEGGTDLLSIKQLLGHNSLRTTMTYVHVSKRHIQKIMSPLDKLGL